jgi:hypothetical protein
VERIKLLWERESFRIPTVNWTAISKRPDSRNISQISERFLDEAEISSSRDAQQRSLLMLGRCRILTEQTLDKLSTLLLRIADHSCDAWSSISGS